MMAGPEFAPRLCRAEHEVSEGAGVGPRDGQRVVTVDKLTATHPNINTACMQGWMKETRLCARVCEWG